MKLLVLYVFHIYNDRVQHFIDNCIYKDENVDFIIISNGKDNKFTVPQGVKTLYRDNIGYDFGGWSDALLTDNLYEKYDKFIFVNSSVIGPFLPPNYKGKWTDIYIDGLKNNVKLFGSTINTCNYPLILSHVQSYIFSVDKVTLQYLINCEIFSMTKYTTGYSDTVYSREIPMSRKIIENGWNIGSLFKQYSEVDFTFKNKKPIDYQFTFFSDVMLERFRNILWKDHDLVFMKGNRINIKLD